MARQPNIVVSFWDNLGWGEVGCYGGWAIDFMNRAHAEDRPFYVYLPYTQMHIPPIPDPEYAGKTKRGNIADLLVQMDEFTGRILDQLSALGIAEDTIVVWTSDNGSDPNWRLPAGDPDPFGGAWNGFSGPWRGGYLTSLEGSNRAPCISASPGGCRPAESATTWCTSLTCSPRSALPAGRHCRQIGRSTGWT